MAHRAKNINDLKNWDINPRTINNEKYDELIQNIEDLGSFEPLVADIDGTVISGNQRLKIAKQLGQSEIEVSIPERKLTDKERKKIGIIANTHAGDFDIEVLNVEFDDVLEELDLGDLLPDIEEIEAEAEIEEDEVPEVPEESKAKLGDIYQLGNHRLMCGDSTNIDDVEKLMNGVKADMVFTDPPYGMNAVSKSGVLSEKYKNDIMNDDDNTVAINSFNLCRNYFKDAKQVWWGANYYTECLPSAECWIVWDKNNGGSDQTDCELAWTNFRSVVRQFTMASEK